MMGGFLVRPVLTGRVDLGLRRALGPFGGRERFHGERMNFCFHAVTKHRVNHLMPGDWPFAFKRRTNNHGLEVMAITIDVQMVAG